MIREKISLSIHEMTVVAMMVAMIAILGAVPGIPLGFIPVPIVLQKHGNNDCWRITWTKIRDNCCMALLVF